MSWDFNKHLAEQIAKVQRDLGLDNFVIEVCDEQTFVKMKFLKENNIYVVTKDLTSTITIDAKTQPVQIMIMTENNSLEVAKLIFSTFADRNNFQVVMDGDTYIKQQYTQPVVLSNFNEVASGYRSVLYISCTLLIMDNLIDIYTFDEDGNQVRNAIKIKTKIGSADASDYEIVNVLAFNVSYSMTPNTQPIPPSLISTSVKSVSTFGVNFVIPPKGTYALEPTADTTIGFLKVISEIMVGNTTGNADFILDFWFGTTHFEAVSMKMTSTMLNSGPDKIPGIQIGLLR